MDFEKYTNRSQGVLKSAQDLAVQLKHQQLTGDHLLKSLLEEEGGLSSGLIEAC